jgi:hypothetical protein
MNLSYGLCSCLLHLPSTPFINRSIAGPIEPQGEPQTHDRGHVREVRLLTHAGARGALRLMLAHDPTYSLYMLVIF